MLRTVDWWFVTDVSVQPMGSLLQCSNSLMVLFLLLTAWPLTMGPIGYPETSVTTSVRSVTSQKSEGLIYTVW